ncbi:MAG: 2-hydroxyglutaryl-CoA dehydratase [Fusobacteriia bacterium 4572_132]|nr:MAG: 2-hydroxyglutaryl-CoA dehydratase [Fusobacteriia bacterium 4572_132]
MKGIYGACIANNITEIVGVMSGDCSNTEVLVEVLELEGIKVYPFLYPHSHKLEDVKIEINKFMELFNVNLVQVEKIRQKLNRVRKLSKKIDEMTYIDNKVSGFENHLYQIILSDLNGDIDKCEIELMEKINEIQKRKAKKEKLRLAYIGVPPMTDDIYDFVRKFDSHFVYNEVQREFAFPRGIEAKNIYEQYWNYTYPYNSKFRIQELKNQIEERKIDAVIHYTQAFCYRAVQDILIKKNLDIPVLNIEGDKINKLDARTKLRLEAFLDMLGDRKNS